MARRIVDIATNNGVYKSTLFPQSVIDGMRANIYIGGRPEIAGSNITELGSVVGSKLLPTQTILSVNEKISFANNNNGSSGDCYIVANGYTWNVFDASYSSDPTAYFSFVIDEENQLGWIICIQKYTRYGNTNYYIYYQMGNNTCYNAVIGNEPVSAITSNGGGATHIAKVTGQLSSLSNNLSDILMISGGGGGGVIIGEDTYAGKDAGGISGNGNNSASRAAGYAFGQGESGEGVSGGGGGLYGGYKGGTS